ncbi:alpha/beta fold hydrolase [Amphiplicatus metriothermophilus]|uniref:alpha/beta fold hydrolase n=1 Tax=Amphiplicatus metriothermophilus TaxID=1519374 RepID=UPI0021A4CBA0|nr:alpha/beta hydrolase [Amphiplicatus metriothermophilus]
MRAAAFPPDAAAGRAPKGCIVLLGGRSEFIEKYFEVVRDLQTRGFAVATFDWRGQGLSERLLPVREKGHILDFGVYRADLRLFTEEIARKRFGGPYVLLTHSMGGTPALQLLADGYDAFAAAVLCAPMTRLFRNPFKRAFAGALARAACGLGAARQPVLAVKEHSLQFEGNALTSDRARHDRFRLLQEAAPNAIIREPTYGWLKAASEAMADLHRPDRFARLKTPVLIVSAERDALVDSTDHPVLAARSPLIEHALIKGALHEILMERDEFRRAFWAAFDAFVEPRIVPAGGRLAAEA